jgi:hypothetical protein
MTAGTRTIPQTRRIPLAAPSDTLAVGVAMRAAFVGTLLIALGGLCGIAGAWTPAAALALAGCGGGLAFVGLRFLQRWEGTPAKPVHHGGRRMSSIPLRQPAFFIE